MPDSLQTLLLQQSQLYSFHVAIEDIIEFELENLTFATVKLELQGAVTQGPSFSYSGNVMCNNIISMDLSVRNSMQVIHCN